MWRVGSGGAGGWQADWFLADRPESAAGRLAGIAQFEEDFSFLHARAYHDQARSGTLCLHSQVITLCMCIDERSPMTTVRTVPEASVARLPVYLGALDVLSDRGHRTVSSEQPAAIAGVSAANLRKDLSYLGSNGIRAVGYNVSHLMECMGEVLGLTSIWLTVVMGAGNLVQALAGYDGFRERGFKVVAILDDDSRVVGSHVADLEVHPLSELQRIVGEEQVSIGIIAVPAASAQQVCDELVATGVRSILSFAPTVLQVPNGVTLRQADLSTELQILAFHADKEKL